MLSAIRANYPSFEEQYREMLLQWINISSATLKRLIDALEANTVQINGIANITRKVCQKSYTIRRYKGIIVHVRGTIAYLLVLG